MTGIENAQGMVWGGDLADAVKGLKDSEEVSGFPMREVDDELPLSCRPISNISFGARVQQHFSPREKFFLAEIRPGSQKMVSGAELMANIANTRDSWH